MAGEQAAVAKPTAFMLTSVTVGRRILHSTSRRTRAPCAIDSSAVPCYERITGLLCRCSVRTCIVAMPFSVTLLPVLLDCCCDGQTFILTEHASYINGRKGELPVAAAAGGGEAEGRRRRRQRSIANSSMGNAMALVNIRAATQSRKIILLQLWRIHRRQHMVTMVGHRR